MFPNEESDLIQLNVQLRSRLRSAQQGITENIKFVNNQRLLQGEGLPNITRQVFQTVRKLHVVSLILFVTEIRNKDIELILKDIPAVNEHC